jgi:Fe-S-cluster containining protein
VKSSDLRSRLPPVYGHLLPAIFDEPAVHEPRATCESCQMCDHGTVPAELEASFFRPDTKCCTYHPSLPNYLVGAILTDESPELAEGNKRVLDQIGKRLGVTPQRLTPSKKWTHLYRASMDSSFGRSLLLRCPYLDDAERCSIWQHREAVCTTYFCKFDRGLAGAQFWQALKGYLAFAEEMLCVWAAKAVSKDIGDPRDGEPAGLSLEELEERPTDDASYRRIWGSWAGREAEFYRACHERVRTLSKAEYAKLVDSTVDGKATLERLATTLARVRKAPVVHERVALNRRLRVLPVAGGVVMTMPYNRHDSMKIETELYDVLKRFSTDHTVAETRETLAAEGLVLEDALLSMFAMHDILVPDAEGGRCEPALPSSLAAGARCVAAKKPTSPTSIAARTR